MISSRTVLAALSLGGGLLVGAPAFAQQVGIEQIAPGQSIRQEGVGNSSTVEISGTGHQGDIVQVGNDNRTLTLARGANARQSIQQHGSNNLGIQASFGLNNVATLTQGSALTPGSGNVALQAQVGANNVAHIVQNGNRNAAAQVQVSRMSMGQALGVAAGLTSDLRAGRAGSRLQELSDMGDGFGNTAELVQDGDDNLAVMVQAGNGNQLDIHQTGGGANVYMQIGDNLSRTATVEQRAGVNGITPIMVIQSR